MVIVFLKSGGQYKIRMPKFKWLEDAETARFKIVLKMVHRTRDYWKDMFSLRDFTPFELFGSIPYMYWNIFTPYVSLSSTSGDFLIIYWEIFQENSK
jgi:hypothetical protein